MADRREPQWAPDPYQGPKQPPDDILTVRPERPLLVAILSQGMEGVHVHWLGNRTVPCTGPQGQCQVNHLAASRRWQGWLCVQAQYSKKPCYLAVTPQAVRQLPELVTHEAPLRGRYLELRRAGTSPSSRLIVRWAPAPGWPRFTLLPEQSIRMFLVERLWLDTLPRLGLVNGICDEGGEAAQQLAASAKPGVDLSELLDEVGYDEDERRQQDRGPGKKGGRK